ncbi:aspartate kinase [Candidatus Daviesbacteria bacterium]|nr:aspartate kinase [Candidatus Daviesbacteria bacterium]
MIVAKFGGTSVSSKERIYAICQVIKSQLEKEPIIVVSALSGVTDLLLSFLLVKSKAQTVKKLQELKTLHKKLIDSLWDGEKAQQTLKFIDNNLEKITKLLKKKTNTKRFSDKLVSFGEIMSSYIIAQVLESQGIRASQIIATELIVTDENYSSAEFLPLPTKRNVKKILTPLIKKKVVPVITGFIGSTKKGQTTTLGRGGSDYSASIIGFCLGVSEIQIWTDVDGIFSADPRLLANAKRLLVVSFKEASELASFGAKILHPRTIRPAIGAGIPVRVLNTFNINNPGTKICEKTNMPSGLKAISFKRKVTLINIYSSEMLLQKGFLARIFQVFADNNISVDLVSVSEVSVSVTLDNEQGFANAVKQLSLFATVSVSENLGIVSLIGEGITSSPDFINMVFTILAKAKILVRMVSLGATNINISIVVESNQIEQAVIKLHNNLLERSISS